MINKNFFLTINELVSRAAGIEDAAIIDETSFIDFGRKLSTIESEDFQNAFANEIANKIRKTIDVVRRYQGTLQWLQKGKMPAQGIVEIIQHGFFDARTADFAKLENNTSPDQFIINKPTQTADYFILSSAYSMVVTISSTELEGAFNSPSEMETFLNGKITYLLNSYNLNREQGRRSLLNSLIIELSTATAATSNDDTAQRYKLVSLYNTTYGLSGGDALTADQAMYSPDFINFAVMMINKVYKKLSTPSYSFNDGSIKTFTPEDKKRLVTLSALDDSIVSFKTSFSPDATVLPTHSSVEFWQKEKSPYIVSTGEVTLVATDGDRGTEEGVYYQVIASGKTYVYDSSTEAYIEVDDFSDAQTDTPATIAVLFDDIRLGEYVELEKTVATHINARALYHNIWQHYQGKLINLKSANAVIFTLE